MHFEPSCLGYGKETFSYKKSKLVKYVIKDEKDSVLLVEKGIYDKNKRLIASIVNGFTRTIIKYPTQDSFFVAHYFYQNKDTILNEAYSRKYLDGGKKIKSYNYQINQNKLGQPSAVQLKHTYKSDSIMTESYYSLDAGILHFIRSYKVMSNQNKKKYEVQSYNFGKDSTHFFYNIEGKSQKVVRYDVYNSKNNIISISEYDDYGNIILINSPNSKKEQFIYLYDAHNNWIERQYLIDDEVMEGTKRVIKYYLF